MKKVFIVTCCTLLFSIRFFGQNTDHCQIIANMLSRNECFQAMDYMKQYKDSILVSKETEAIYKYKMHSFMNRPDSSAYYLDKMFKDYPYVFSNDANSQLYFLNELVGLYNDARNYAKVIDTYTLIEQSVQKLPTDENWKKSQLAILAKCKEETSKCLTAPEIKVVNLSRKNEVVVDITKKNPLINIPIECNGVSLQTWVDTGWGSYLFMNKKTADRCNMKTIPSPLVQQDSIAVNGKRVRGHVAVIDSLKLGDFLFTNIPACVVSDDYFSFYSDSVRRNEKHVARYDSVFGYTDVILGLPLLRMLGSIEFDWDKSKVLLKSKKDTPLLKEDPNMFQSQEFLYGRLSVNGSDYVGLLDSGAKPICLSLAFTYYQQHRDNILLSSQEKTREMLGIVLHSLDSKYQTVSNAEVLFSNKRIHLGENDVIVFSGEQPAYWKDGLVGLPFFKSLGSKVKFDFVNMRLTAE